jgi:hypothetical protein
MNSASERDQTATKWCQPHPISTNRKLSDYDSGPRAAFFAYNEPPDGVESRQAAVWKSIIPQLRALTRPDPKQRN